MGVGLSCVGVGLSCVGVGLPVWDGTVLCGGRTSCVGVGLSCVGVGLSCVGVGLPVWDGTVLCGGRTSCVGWDCPVWGGTVLCGGGTVLCGVGLPVWGCETPPPRGCPVCVWRGGGPPQDLSCVGYNIHPAFTLAPPCFQRQCHPSPHPASSASVTPV